MKGQCELCKTDDVKLKIYGNKPFMLYKGIGTYDDREKELCAVCATTHISGILRRPTFIEGQEVSGKEILESIAQCTNMILMEIRKLKES